MWISEAELKLTLNIVELQQCKILKYFWCKIYFENNVNFERSDTVQHLWETIKDVCTQVIFNQNLHETNQTMKNDFWPIFTDKSELKLLSDSDSKQKLQSLNSIWFWM